jgi:hypothetical protein
VTFSLGLRHEPGLKVPLVLVCVSNPDRCLQSEFKRKAYLVYVRYVVGVEMVAHTRAKVKGFEFESLQMHLFFTQ